MNIRAINTEEDYNWALKEVVQYFDKPPASGTAEADRFDVLSRLIESYENQQYQIPDADPVDVLHFAIDEMGHTQAELATLIGRNRASEVLNRKRHLNLEMIRKINAGWGIPFGALIGSYDLADEQQQERQQTYTKVRARKVA
jgi:HTH-type transcriptional regulator / antitoxin HigA